MNEQPVGLSAPALWVDTPAEPRRIAVLRALPGLGDFLCVVPALRALRQSNPDAVITYVGLAASAPLVRRFGAYVDELLPVPGIPGLPEQPADPPAVPGFLAAAQARRFDVALQLHGSGEVTNLLAALLGALFTAGFALPDSGRDGAFDDSVFLDWRADEPEVCRPLRLLAALGIPAASEALEFPLTDDDRGSLEAELERIGTGALDRPYACIHAGAAAADRRWSIEGFARVADGLASDGLNVVLTGLEADAPVTSAVREAMRHHAIDLTGRTELGAMAALLEGACLAVTNDTGVSHLADALRLPSVVVFSATDPARWAPLDRRRHLALGPGAQPDAVLAAARSLLRVEGRHAA